MSTYPSQHIRSALFVPGSRPERFAKALDCGADCVIVDFEDAVEEGLKVQARDNLDEFLQANPEVRLAVRINAPGHREHAADIAFCARHPGVSTIVLPKAQSAEEIEALAVCVRPIWPLIESAKGLLALEAISSAPYVERLSFGALDLALDLRLENGSLGADAVMTQARYAIVLHSVNAGLAKPVETVFADIADTDGLIGAAENGREMGFGAMLCIHPRQVETVNSIFAVNETQLLWARKVLALAETQAGAFQFEGQMIDAPVLGYARRLVQDSRG
ncbi:HpcH/HpaI aldolase/citrate lyase family protein [Pseudomonas sp. NPDC087697]|uniref:HpcH/HpaI aldolase/citrate lyase family protein n=1 Tax=Pseudomonas sp. NPDC087697 TaxID=3364447 RepID=UPI0037F66583